MTQKQALVLCSSLAEIGVISSISNSCHQSSTSGKKPKAPV